MWRCSCRPVRNADTSGYLVAVDPPRPRYPPCRRRSTYRLPGHLSGRATMVLAASGTPRKGARVPGRWRQMATAHGGIEVPRATGARGAQRERDLIMAAARAWHEAHRGSWPRPKAQLALPRRNDECYDLAIGPQPSMESDWASGVVAQKRTVRRSCRRTGTPIFALAIEDAGHLAHGLLIVHDHLGHGVLEIGASEELGFSVGAGLSDQLVVGEHPAQH